MDNICEIHKEKMTQEERELVYGLFKYTEEYTRAKSQYFPNCGDPKLGGCMLPPREEKKERVTLWFCQSCRNAKRAWLKEDGSKEFINSA